MTSSKSSQRRFSALLSVPKTATPPLDELLEAVRRREEADADADEASVASDTEPVPAMSTTTTTSPVARRRTRLQRLSSYLPSIITQAESKFLQDIGKDAEKPASIPRKPAPARYRAKSQSVPPSTQSSSLPPSTSTPLIAQPNAPAKLQKAERPPSRAAPVPAPNTDLNSPLPAVPSKLQKESPNRQKTLPKVRSPAPSPHGSPIVLPRERGDSLSTPPVFNDVGTGTRVVSSPATSRPISGYISDGEGPSTGNKLRRSWLPGKSRHTSQDSTKGQSSTAWLIAEKQKIDYNLGPLTQGEKVPELWDENGDTFVYLFPRTSDQGPSFKVPSVVLSSSQPLISLVHGDIYAGRARAKSFDGRGSLSVDDATRNLAIRGPGTPPYTPSTNPMDSTSNSDGSAESVWSGGSDGPREIHLYLPINLSTDGSGGVPKSQSDIQTLVDARNLFAFLTCQPLVATRTCNSLFLVFVAIAKLLKQFEFTNFDNSTLGEAASASFSFYLDQMRLADVAHSREKTLEAIILGEQMRSTELYNEAFAHAAGRYSAIKEIKSPLFDQINHITRNRLERAALDLKSRQQSVNDRLTDFEFPSLFSGVAASTARPEAKYVNWKAWKTSFFSFRKVFISYYKHLHGSWPPKASSKKNQFEESGLNRLVLKGLYRDLSSLYDLLANREALTTRHYDTSDEEESNVDPLATALRVVLSEYDRSSPPVQPPIPFDVPRVPTMTTVDPTFPFLAPKDQHRLSTRKLKSHETLLILAKSHNLDSDFKTPFLEMFKSFEEKEAKGKNAQELADQRYGHWLFMYAVLQALPMLVVDAPDLRFTQGVEYFLCEPPMGSAPWLEDSSNVKMAWYGVQGGAGVVSLPSDVVLYGVEGIYRRSHCWTVAEQWLSASESEAPLAPPAPLDSMGGFGDESFSPLKPPPGFAGGQLGSRPNSRGRDSVHSGARSSPGLSPHNYSDDERMSRSRQSHRSSIALGLEQLPIPAGGFGGASFGEEFSPSMTPTGHGSRNGSPAKYGGRQQSVGRYSPARGEATPPATAGNTSGSTFDDILMNIGNDSKASKKEKRKSIGF